MRTPELHAIEVEGMTRAAFILRGALAAGAAYGGGAVAPFVSRAFAQGAAGDVDILTFALSLERMEQAFYAAATKRAELRGELKQLATNFGKQEAEHADALEATIQQFGGKPGEAPKFKFGLSDEASFLKVGVALEDVGVGAYNGAAPNIDTPDIISAAGAIVQVEARHAAALRMHADQDPAPNAFDRPLTPAQAQAAAKKAIGG